MSSLQVVSTGQSLSLDWVQFMDPITNHKKYEQGGFLATWEEVYSDEEEVYSGAEGVYSDEERVYSDEKGCILMHRGCILMQ